MLTVAELREHIETDLGDAALTRLADAAASEITDIAGEIGPVTDVFRSPHFPHGKYREVQTRRKIDSISAIVERHDHDGTATTLDATDYEQVLSRTIVRRGDGPNPARLFAPITEVTYQPVVDTALRDRVQIDLVKLAVQFSGLTSERYGDINISHGVPRDQYEAAIRPLRKTRRPVA